MNDRISFKNLAISTIVSVLSLNACQNLGQDMARSDLQTRPYDLASSTASERLILESTDLDSLENHVKSNQQMIHGRMEHTSALIVQMSGKEATDLKSSFPDLKIYQDVELRTIIEATGKSGGSTTAPPQTIPWGISAIRASQAQLTTKGAGSVVCVVDTGIDVNHSDLKANILGGKNFVIIKGKLTPTAYADDNGHGTHVSGTIAAIDNTIGVVGVAPQAKLQAMKVLDSRGSGYLSAIADGVNECVARGVHVINMSLGGNADPTLDSPFKQAVDHAASLGIMVVVAAGNETQDIKNTVPAGFASVIAVSALDSSLKIASFSNFGLGTKDFAAPGVSVYSTWKGNSYNTLSGTSMASPHVAGVAALAVSMGLHSMRAYDLGLPISLQGAGLIDAMMSLTP